MTNAPFLSIQQFLSDCNRVFWGDSFPGILLFLLLGSHLFFSFKLRFVQRFTFQGIRLSLGHGTGFSSLSTILAATIGIGNIVGVSTAIALGGPGAVFWCVLTGVLGMATSYAECYLSIRYRKQLPDGSGIGGPMYVLQYGMHCLPLGILYATLIVISSLGVGSTIQAQAAAEAAGLSFHIPPYITGIILSVLAGFALIGGAASIRKVCSYLVPAMGLFFFVSCFFILYLNRSFILPSVSLILRSAFLPSAAKGGLVGSTILTAARFGVARGLFTNEAGLGSAAIAAAYSKRNEPMDPCRGALISMTAVFWDTIVLCSVTGLAVVTHLLRYPNNCVGLAPTLLTSAAFEAIPYIGTPLLSLSTIAFSFATILGWYHFGEQAFLYLLSTLQPILSGLLPSSSRSNPRSGKKAKDPTPLLLKGYQILSMLMIFFGSLGSSALIWELTDWINACLAIPNLLCLLLLQYQVIAPGDYPSNCSRKKHKTVHDT